MSKNVLILTGSPRKGGNSEVLAEAFAAGAVATGHTVSFFHAGRKKIAPCKACDGCWKTGHACSVHDDFTELEPLLEAADVLAFASPLYWFGFSAQIKAAIDRLYAYGVEKAERPLQIQEGVLLTCAALEDMQVFDGIIGTYKNILQYLGWNDAGVLAIPNAHKKGDMLSLPDALAAAKQLGANV